MCQFFYLVLIFALFAHVLHILKLIDFLCICLGFLNDLIIFYGKLHI